MSRKNIIEDRESYEHKEEASVQSEYARLYEAVLKRVGSSSTSDRHPIIPLIPFPYSRGETAEFEGVQSDDKTQIGWEFFAGRPDKPLLRKQVVFIGTEFEMTPKKGQPYSFHQQLLIESGGRSIWYIEEYNRSWERVNDLKVRKHCLDSFRKAAVAAGVSL